MFQSIRRCATTANLLHRKNFSDNRAPGAIPHGFHAKPDVNDIQCDYIGPPDKESNLRPILRHIAANESPTELRLRLGRLEVEHWNQQFWANHNRRFYEEKEEFIAVNKTAESDTLSADKMSVFYKAFLDKNWKLHFYYNISWYIKNFGLMVLATRVAVQKRFKRRKPAAVSR